MLCNCVRRPRAKKAACSTAVGVVCAKRTIKRRVTVLTLCAGEVIAVKFQYVASMAL